MIEKRVDERPVGIADGGMHHHALRLVDDENVPVLVNDVERDVLGERFRGDGLRFRDGDDVSRAHLIPLRKANAIHRDLPRLDPPDRRGAGDQSEAGDGSVQPFSRLGFGYVKYHVSCFSFFS